MFLFSFLSSTKGGIPPVSFAFDFFHLIISSGSHSISILEIFLVLFFNYMALTEVTTFLKLFCKCKRRFGVHSMSILCERINDEKLLFFFWLCCVFVSVRGLSLVAASGGHSSSQCAGLSLSRPLPLRSTGSRRAGSVGVAHGPSCSAACGIFPDQARTRVPCIGRQILNHCTTREAPRNFF